MPSLGADMEAGTLTEWLKQPGDSVRQGDIVAVVETQKGAIEIEIFNDGVIDRILIEPGEKVPVGTVLALVRGEGEPAATPPPVTASPPPEPVVAAAPTTEAASVTVEAHAAAPTGPGPAPSLPGIRISPLARRRAAELGVDVSSLAGTGTDGAVRLADVEREAAGGTPIAQDQPPPVAQRRGFDPDAMRQAIAAAMAKSKREIPHYYLGTSIDMTRATAWLEQANADRPVAARLLLGVLLLKAVALALRKAPELNGFWTDGAFRPDPGIHVGWAIALRGGGLMAPAIHDADRKNLDELMTALRDLVGRARAGGIRGSELTDATVTVTSLGERGVETIYGIIYPPQVGLVGFGRLTEAPRVVDGAVVPRPVIAASLAGDHRASDGHRGALFLSAIEALLQTPEDL